MLCGVLRTMEEYVPGTTSETTSDVIAGNPFFVKSLERRDYDGDENSSQVLGVNCLKS